MVTLLQEKIEQVVHTFPWYSSSLSDQDLPLENVKFLHHLPLMTSPLLERHYYSREHPYSFLDKEMPNKVYTYLSCGTSTNRRKKIYYSEKDEQQYVKTKIALFRKLLPISTIKSAFVDLGSGHAASTALSVFAKLGVKADTIPKELPLQHHVKRLTELKPDVLYIRPSILAQFLQLYEQNLSAWKIHYIILVGESTSEIWRNHVAKLLGIPCSHIKDTYETLEIGTAAYYSPTYKRFLFTDGICAEGIGLEMLDKNLSPLSKFESVLVLTSFIRELFPAIRFVTYDVVRDMRPIFINGKPHMSFACFVRKLGPDLKHGKKISVYDIEKIVYKYAKHATARVQMHNNELTVFLKCNVHNPDLYQCIKKEITNCIPEIGEMVHSNLLGEIKVLPEVLDLPAKGMMVRKRIYIS